MFVSTLYGLCITSPWPLGDPPPPDTSWPALELVETSSRLAPGDGAAAGRREWFRHVRLRDGSDYLCWKGLAEFVVAPDGGRVTCHPVDGCSPETLRTYLLGQAVSFALVKRGIEPLHATAVVVDDAAVAFVGDCGFGKSSLAAGFIANGAALVTDDLLVIRPEREGEMAYAGPRRIKLFPHVARRVLGTAAGARMNRGTRKLLIPLGGARCARQPVALRAIYVLGRPRAARRIVIRRLPLRRAFLALVGNTFNPVVADRARLVRLLDEASRVASSLPVRSLSFPRRLTVLPDVVAAIRADLAS